MKKCLCTILALVLMLSCVCLPASAVEIVESDGNQPVARATSRFTIDVKANSSMRASTSFPMEVGEVITIKASYAPFSASVDVGLVGPTLPRQNADERILPAAGVTGCGTSIFLRQITMN